MKYLLCMLFSIAALAESLPSGTTLRSIKLDPASVSLTTQMEYAQVLATAVLDGGKQVDITRFANLSLTGDAVTISPTGEMRPAKNGKATLTVSLNGKQASLPITVSGQEDDFVPDYVRDVMPVLSTLGCNQGTCHGAKDGKNGFQLSLRGYDPIKDVRSFTDDHAGRRINLAAPDQSLMLLKATAAVPHEGQQLLTTDSRYYTILRNWISGGVKLDMSTPRVTSITLEPENPVVDLVGSKQQFRVVATYADGLTRDVTAEAFIESGDQEVALHNNAGLLTTLRRGEAPILARFEGRYATTILTVMGDRSGFAWKQPPTWGRIDELVADKWQRMQILPSEVCDDASFLRRVHLDLTGLPPTPEQVTAFLADTRNMQTKRNEVIDQLIGNEAFVDYWANKWADLLQVNRKFLAPEGAKLFRNWIRNEVAANTPYDAFVHKILTASGSNKTNPPASYYKILRNPEDTMENTTHLFLATRFNCNKCHDHPFERWTQDQYYEVAAFFAQTGLKKDPQAGDKQIGKTAVEAGKPMFEIIYDQTEGEVKHERTGQIMPPKVPYEATTSTKPNATRREQLADWITAPDNRYFASTFANRVWGYLTGTGIIEPLDDVRAGNPPSNPQLLEYLTKQLVANSFDVRSLMREICQSRTYQLSINTHKWNVDDTRNYSHAIARRLPAEVLYDSIMQVTGSSSRFPGVPVGTRASALPDVGVSLPDGFLGNLGRPVRESACECERSTGLQLGPIMALISGPTLNNAISDPTNHLTKMVKQQPDDSKLIDALYLRILNRPPMESERNVSLKLIRSLKSEHEKLIAQRDAARKKHEPRLAEKETERSGKIATAQTALNAYRKETAAARKQADEKRKQAIASAEAAMKAFRDELPARLSAWEAGLASSSNQPVAWTALRPSKLAGSIDAKLTLDDAGNITATGPTKRGTYELIADTQLEGITGFRLDALADKSLPSNGPGRAPNGNIVVSEFEVHAAPISDANPTPFKKINLQQATASFSQGGYDVTTAIDGKAPANGNGWALSGNTGKDNWASFETASNIRHPGGSRLKMILNQQFQDGKHTLGKFRLSVTTAPRPFGDSMPEAIAAVLAVAPDKRNETQKKTLRTYFEENDTDYQERSKALAKAKQPLPVDPKMNKLEAQLATAEKPVPLHPVFAELQRASQLSEQQLASERLTATQDIAWALMNHPSFLFAK